MRRTRSSWQIWEGVYIALARGKPLFYKTKGAILALVSSSKIGIRVENDALFLISDWSSFVVYLTTINHFIHHKAIGSLYIFQSERPVHSRVYSYPN